MMMRKIKTKGMIMRMKMPEQTTMDHRWTGCRTLIFKSYFSSRWITQELPPERRLHEEIVVILWELEMYFLPAFFDVMVHLLVHIVEDIIQLGPTFLPE